MVDQAPKAGPGSEDTPSEEIIAPKDRPKVPKQRKKRKYKKKERSPEEVKAYIKAQSDKSRKRWKLYYEQKKAEKLQVPREETKQSKFKELKKEIAYKPTPSQWRFAEAIKGRARVILFLGGIRAGKTFAGAQEALKQIYKYNRLPNLGWIVSPTYPMSQVPERLFRAHAGALVGKHMKGERSFLMVPPKSMPNHYYRVEVKSAEEPDRLRGPSLGWIWIDEGAMITKECWDILFGRVLDSKGIIFITTTPRGRNWLYDDVYLRSLKDPAYVCIQAPTSQNPYLDQREIQDLRSRYSGEFARQELDAEFMGYEGLVYKDYSPVFHQVKRQEIPQNAYIVCGVDFGYNDPFVCLWLAKWDGVWHLVDEHYQAGKTLDYHIQVIKDNPLYSRVEKYWGDPSAAQQRADMRAAGIPIFPAIRIHDKSSRRSINTGIQEVTRWLNRKSLNGSPMFELWKNVINTHNEFMQYRYREPTNRNAGETPIDDSNHAMDALRYALSSESRVSGDFRPRYQDDSGAIKVVNPREQNNKILHDHFKEQDKLKEKSPRQPGSMFPEWYSD